MYQNNKRYALTNCVILDGSEHMEPQMGKAVCIDREKIAEITDAQHIPAGYETVDLGGRYVLPGLINMHVHLPASGKPKKKASDPKKLVKLITSCGLMNKIGVNLCEGYAKTELLSGVTTIRTVGGVADYDTRIRDLAAAGKTLAPRVLASNMAVSVPGGHMAGSLAYEAHTAAEAAAFVEKIAGDKPDLIKLMITGGVLDAEVVGEPGVLRMPPELVKAACDKAHSLGMLVAAHVESPEGVIVALQNGVDSIEHGAQPTQEMLDLFKARGAFQISTISPALPYALFDRSISHATYEQQENGKIVFDGIIALAKANLASGVPVGLGTDVGCPYITHYDMWRELNHFVKYCGVTPAFALYSATKLNARLAGIGDVTGSIEAGKQADLIVCADDPLKSPSALRTLDMVVKGGYRIDKPQVKKMPEVERELDKFL
ncbi:MAG: amidohydrolase family protein [Oscillibacter sp.]|nr:amidohydrolase family protein [Oscillibacter sp.]MDY4908195.1 amidohydrolase family protein [Oscillospiraceae bacterium]